MVQKAQSSVEFSNEHQDCEEPKKANLFTASAIVGAIGWFLGISMNGLFNFFSDKPGIQLYPFCIAVCGYLSLMIVRIAIRRDYPWLLMLASSICATIFVVTSKLVDRKQTALETLNSPIVSPPRIQLHDGKLAKQSEVIIANPSDLPLHLVVLRIQPTPLNVLSSSLRIDLEPLENGPAMESGRINHLPSTKDSLNETYFMIYTVPPKSHRTLQITVRFQQTVGLNYR